MSIVSIERKLKKAMHKKSLCKSNLKSLLKLVLARSCS